MDKITINILTDDAVILNTVKELTRVLNPDAEPSTTFNIIFDNLEWDTKDAFIKMLTIAKNFIKPTAPINDVN